MNKGLLKTSRFFAGFFIGVISLIFFSATTSHAAEEVRIEKIYIDSNYDNRIYTKANQDVIHIKIDFSEKVSRISGIPLLYLNVNNQNNAPNYTNNNQQRNYAVYNESRSSGNTVVFDYTVKAGDYIADLDAMDLGFNTSSGKFEFPSGSQFDWVVPQGDDPAGLASNCNVSIQTIFFLNDGSTTTSSDVKEEKTLYLRVTRGAAVAGYAQTFAVSSDRANGDKVEYPTTFSISAGVMDAMFSVKGVDIGMQVIRLHPYGYDDASGDLVATINVVGATVDSVTMPLREDGCLISDFWAGVQGAVSWFCAGSVRIQNLTVEVDFGDGSHKTVSCNANNAGVAFHTYSYPGLYYITLNATDSTGSTKTTRGFVKVNPQGYEGVTAAGNSGNGGNGEAMGEGEVSGGTGNVVAGVSLTVTNIIVHYVTQSVPSDAVIPSTTAGIVNVITEVDAGAPVAISPAWAEQYPDFEAKFGSDFSAAIVAETGKRDGAGNAMRVWQDFVAGTDPTDPDSVFTASITFDAETGLPVISWSPELSPEEAAKRTYRKYGKVKLTDENWTEIDGDEASYNFFKVSVEMK